MSTPWGERKSTSTNTTTVSGTSGIHTFTEEEKFAFSDWINDTLSGDPDLKDILKIDPNTNQLFSSVHNGILLCKMINDAVPNTIDERVINKTALNPFKIHENHTLSLNSAKSIGCNVINISSHDLMEGTTHLVLGLMWQIIKIGLLSKIDLKHHPELYRLLEDGETIEDLLKLPAEQILLRWFNYHLREAGHPRRVNNFSGDIKDSENYTILLNQIAPKSKGVDKSALGISDLEQRADRMLEQADKLDCRKFVRPKDVCAGNPKLNLAFVANLFNNYPALEPMDEEIEIIEETREEKTFRNWMNSLGVDPHVNNLYEDLRDGLVLIQLFDKIQPGIVDWKRVNKPPYAMGGNMKKIENCNYACELGKELNFSLVGISGNDINSGNKTLTLAVVWQMMRAYTLQILAKLSKDGTRISDNEIIEWANGILSSKGLKITGWKDKSIRDSKAIAEIVESIRSGTIQYDLLLSSTNEKDLLENAKYVISAGRKIGAVIFALPEDIVEVNPKMVLTIFASLMAVAMGAN